jgi:hypothetical protein
MTDAEKSAVAAPLSLKHYDRIDFLNTCYTLNTRFRELRALLKPHNVGLKYVWQEPTVTNVVYLYPMAEAVEGVCVEDIGWPFYIHPSCDIDVSPNMPDMMMDTLRVWVDMGEQGQRVHRIQSLMDHMGNRECKQQKILAAGHLFAYLEFYFQQCVSSEGFKGSVRIKATEFLADNDFLAHTWAWNTVQRVRNMLV